MTWTKHGDDYPDRMWSLSNAAYRLHDHATIFSNRLLTDGHIPDDRLASLAPLTDEERALAVSQLVARGLWQREAGGYCLAEFGIEQLPAAVIAQSRRVETLRKAWGRAKKAGDSDRLVQLGHELDAARAEIARLKDAAISQRVPVGHPVGLPAGVPGVPTRPDPNPTRPVGSGSGSDDTVRDDGHVPVVVPAGQGAQRVEPAPSPMPLSRVGDKYVYTTAAPHDLARDGAAQEQLRIEDLEVPPIAVGRASGRTADDLVDVRLLGAPDSDAIALFEQNEAAEGCRSIPPLLTPGASG
jgi:hypothetical protein